MSTNSVGGGVIDLVVTDPPYNVDYGSKAEAINKYGYRFSDRHIKNDYMPEAQFIEFLDKAFGNMEKHLKKGGAFYIWHASITVYEFEEALRLNSLKTRQQLIWVKNAMVLGRQDYQWRHEPCLYGWKEGASHYFVPNRTKTTVKDAEELKDMKKNELIDLIESIFALKKQSIIFENKPTRSDEHPTMKPVKLISQLIANSSREGENVLDLFGGSGTTLIACEQLNRKCYMMEYDPHYVDVIIDRWETFTGKKAVLLK
jgi:DNA modification methylase